MDLVALLIARVRPITTRAFYPEAAIRDLFNCSATQLGDLQIQRHHL